MHLLPVNITCTYLVYSLYCLAIKVAIVWLLQKPQNKKSKTPRARPCQPAVIIKIMIRHMLQA